MPSESASDDLVGATDNGTFVRTRLGLGRLVGLSPVSADVRYFQAPGRSPYVEKQHPLSEVAPAILRQHTRVYLHDGRRWRIGRVDGSHPQDSRKYLIAFPNAEGTVLADEAFDVRWNRPIPNPFDVLESVGGDSPLVYESRLDLLGEWARQKAAASGVEGLVLGSVELHSHQLDVVRRVAADPVKRYLLADEVGLGKTIEAGALIWQFVVGQPEGRVLVLAPDHLRQQWGEELLGRFHTDQFTRAWIRIVAHDDEAAWPTDPVDLLVIDEAHHVTRAGALAPRVRDRIAELAHDAQALLLLSATPVRSNEAGFLDLLHLLDPVNYRPDQLEDFVRRVDLRDHLALTYQSLVPDLDAFDLSLYADELRSMFPDDSLLAGLLDDALAASDKARPAAVGRLREHLSETYRLHHRLLRTRRTPDISTTFAVRGRKRAIPFTADVADPSDGLRVELLDSLRIHIDAATEAGEIGGSDGIEIFREVAQRCGALSDALLPLQDRSNAQQVHVSLGELYSAVGDDVVKSWFDRIDAIHDLHSSVVGDLVAHLSRVTIARGVPRTVVASTFTECAHVLSDEISRTWGAQRVAVHLSDRSYAENAAEVARWRGEGPCCLLVCDSSAEEGINLQDADLLVHLDLPWDSFRLEQRIGRCDRHAAHGLSPIPSMVVAFGDQSYARGWFEFVADGCGVFDRSVSSLQYVLRDTERTIHEAVLHRGPAALPDAVDTQAAALAAERTRITAHDALDAVEAPRDVDHETSDAALIASDSSRSLANALMTWMEGVGLSVRRPSPGTIRIDKKPRPQVPFDLEARLAPFQDKRLALSRSAAVNNRLPILRAGHRLVDTVAEHLQETDRGIAFALLRPARGQWPPAVVIRTDFQVSSLYPNDFVAKAEEWGLSSWAKQIIDEVMPPLVETVLMTIDGRETSHPSLLRHYDKHRGDLNLSSRPDFFAKLTAHLDWAAVCSSALETAEHLVRQRSSVVGRPSRAVEELRARIHQRADRTRARGLAGMEVDDVVWTRLEASLPDVLEPRIDVIGCGVIFVADPSRAE